MNRPLSYGAAALYGFGLETLLESHEAPVETAAACEGDSAPEAEAETEFTHPCPLKEMLE